MRKYEVVCILHPDLDETAMTAAVDRIKGWITEAGGTISTVDVWGKRQLAYAIRKQRTGQYVYLEADMEPASTKELDRNLRFLEPLMRYMIVV